MRRICFSLVIVILIGLTACATKQVGDKGELDTRATKEISFQFGTSFPHGPGPITRSRKWTFDRPVSKAVLITNNSSPYCKKLELLTAENLVYVVATFQAQWDQYVFAKGTFLVMFDTRPQGSTMAPETQDGEDTPAPQNLCDALTTKGKCWTGSNCNGTLTSSSTSCTNCRDYLSGKSFQSLNTGKCYPTSEKMEMTEKSYDRCVCTGYDKSGKQWARCACTEEEAYLGSQIDCNSRYCDQKRPQNCGDSWIDHVTGKRYSGTCNQ